eukprot:2117241-Amphidinium_carterae.1
MECKLEVCFAQDRYCCIRDGHVVFEEDAVQYPVNTPMPIRQCPQALCSWYTGGEAPSVYSLSVSQSQGRSLKFRSLVCSAAHLVLYALLLERAFSVLLPVACGILSKLLHMCQTQSNGDTQMSIVSVFLVAALGKEYE